MAKINYDSSQVEAVLKSIESKLEALKLQKSILASEVSSISAYWDSAASKIFVTKLENLIKLDFVEFNYLIVGLREINKAFSEARNVIENASKELI